MRFEDHFLEEVRAASDIIEVISPYVKLKKKGKNWFGLCPFHNEKTPSFSVQRERGMYYCFGCGVGGNAITFLVEHDGMTFPQAVEELATRAGIAIPVQRAESEERERDRDLVRDALESAAQFYQGMLKDEKGTEAVNYLKSRGITGATAKTFRLGYAPDGWDILLNHLKEKGFSEDLQSQAGLVKPRESGGFYDTFRNRLVFPFMDRRGRVCAFGGRTLDESDDSPKYLNGPETAVFRKGSVLYGLPQAVETMLKEERALLVEGYFDVMSLHQAGIKGVVAASGTAFTEKQALILKRLVKKVQLLFDADAAGLKAAFRSYTSLVREGLEAAFLPMPHGEDPDTMIRSEGAETFRSRLRHAMGVVTFYFDSLDTPVEELDVGERAAVTRDLLDLLRHDGDSLRRSMSLQEVSARVGLDEGTLMKEMEALAEREAPYEERRTGSQAPQTQAPPSRVESDLLRMLLSGSESNEEILSRITSDDFKDQRASALFKRINDDFSTRGSISIDRLLEHVESTERGLIASLLAEETPVPSEEGSAVVEQFLRSVETRRSKEHRQRLKASIDQARRAGDDETVERLLKEYQEMSSE
ncbi:DNA primase [Candidatus Zixiibacteriota bacterium]